MDGNRIAALSAGLAIFSLLAASPGIARDRGADGKFSERRSSHFVLRQDVAIDDYSGHRGSRQFELAVLGALEDAYDALGNSFGIRPGRSIQVFVYDPGVFDSQYAGLFRFQAAGFFHGVIRVRGGSRIDGALVHTLHHEYVHAALDQEAPASAVIPAWVNEGFAEWFAHRQRGKRQLSGGEWSFLNEALRNGELPTISGMNVGSFAHLGPRQAGLAYVTSYAAVDLLVGRFGEAAFRSFLRDYFRNRQVERSLRRNFRLEMSGLDAALADSLSG